MGMWDFFGSLVGAGTAAYGIRTQAEGQKETNKANIQIAQDQMDFQERMSGTAYSRAMDDMRTAGLNPILAYKQGGASAPYGAAIASVNPWAGAGAGGAAIASSAFAGAKLPNEMKRLEAEVAKVLQDKETSGAVERLRGLDRLLVSYKIDTEKLTQDQLRKQIGKLSVDTAKVQMDLKLMIQALKSVKAKGFSDEIYEKFLKENPWLRKIEALGKALGMVETGVRIVK